MEYKTNSFRYCHTTRFFAAELLTCLLLTFFGNAAAVSRYSEFEPKLTRSTSDQVEMVKSKFIIHPDTIILTRESRAMGGKYINETEVLSNDECLLWCWENSYCNVAVFEEMTRRSCFLFDCGPPADFRCKFMLHQFYTSSVLKGTQHSYELKQWGNEMKEEKAKAATKTLTMTTVPTTAAPVPVATDAVLKSPASVSPTPVEPNVTTTRTTLCRHYQFQCLNSSECIAIYNVCDGIPQCPDGSDESIELHCPSDGNSVDSSPSEKSLPPHPTRQNPAVNITSLDQSHIPQELPPSQPKMTPNQRLSVNHGREKFLRPTALDEEKSIPVKDINEMIPWPESYSGRSDSMDYDRPMEGSNRMRSPFNHKHSTFVAANNVQIPNKWQNEYERYNQPSASGLEQQYNVYESRLEDESYPKGQYPDYERPGYDAYRPEDGSLWVDQERLRNGNYLNSDFSQANVPSSNRQIAYPNREDLYVQQQLPVKIDTANRYIPIDKELARQAQRLHESSHRKLIPEQESLPIHRPNKPRPQQHYMPYEDMPRTDYRLYPEAKAQLLDTAEKQAEAAQIYDRDEALRESLNNQLQSLPNKPIHMYEPIAEVPVRSTLHPIHKGTTIDTINAKTTESSTASSKIKTTKADKKNLSAEEKEKKITAAELYQARSIRVHESNNAIVALTLGLIVLALLLLLVGCQLRTMKRRSLRRGRPLAHDADYLVNGLYL